MVQKMVYHGHYHDYIAHWWLPQDLHDSTLFEQLSVTPKTHIFVFFWQLPSLSFFDVKYWMTLGFGLKVDDHSTCAHLFPEKVVS